MLHILSYDTQQQELYQRLKALPSRKSQLIFTTVTNSYSYFLFSDDLKGIEEKDRKAERSLIGKVRFSDHLEVCYSHG